MFAECCLRPRGTASLPAVLLLADAQADAKLELYGRRRVAKWGFAMLIHGTQTGHMGIGFRAAAEMTVIESDACIVGSALTVA